MMVTFISQCEKSAIKKTRQILDAFANRIGDKTWQTIITNEGLKAVKKLLCKTASRNTAVACHWLRGRSCSELVWIVGSRQKFNLSGLVPVNITHKKLLKHEWENNWHYLPVIKSLTALAALFHDFGKATLCFQNKLIRVSKISDPLRHEWISLLLFNALVRDKSDEEWLQQLAKGELNENLLEEAVKKNIVYPMENLSPLASLVAWLIVTHHKLPLIKNEDDLKTSPYLETIGKMLSRVSAEWGYKSDEAKNLAECFKFPKGLASQSQLWLKQIKKWSLKTQNCLPLIKQAESDDSLRLILHYSRLALMLGDHHYSSQEADINWQSTLDLFANTNRESGALKQKLDEHLVGVMESGLNITHLLPIFETEMPYVPEVRALKKKSPAAYSWQDKAVANIKIWQQNFFTRKQSNQQYGFFAVNMASTGCGKTLANAKVMQVLSPDNNSLRFVLALGLRTLTLQTGNEYRMRMGLTDNELAIIIGSKAIANLYAQNNFGAINDKLENSENGSESAESLFDNELDFQSDFFEDKLNTVLRKNRDKQVLYAPVLVCTIDHIMAATECMRGGKYILPTLRLMSSDLVIDEIDDFSGNDLIAIGRLIHLAGMLGRKVMISSATIPPALAQGYFNVYREGWLLFTKTRGLTKQIGCAWIDEFNTQIETVFADASTLEADKNFRVHHQSFIAKRVEKLKQQLKKRKAEIIDCSMICNQTNNNFQDKTQNSDRAIELLYFEVMQKAIIDKHRQHAFLDSESQKNISFGVVRMANISPCVNLTKFLVMVEWPEDIEVRVMAYHSQQVLLLRHYQEKHLDAALKRNYASDDQKHTIKNPLIRRHIESVKKPNLIFILVATPVEEVGRDHDFDWGVVEPSSMRSIIQLSGRILRHREYEPQYPNVAIMQYNLRALKNNNISEIAYCWPGYESQQSKLQTHNLLDLLDQEFLQNINAVPRIQRLSKLMPNKKLADLEHAAQEKMLTTFEELGAATMQGWLTQHWWLSALSQYFIRFRKTNNDDELRLYWVSKEESTEFMQKDDKGRLSACELRYMATGPRLTSDAINNFWWDKDWDYARLLEEQARKDEITVVDAAELYGEVVVAFHREGQCYQYSPYLGLCKYDC
jgi:CRISPR-associated endonuclease/helicase Cas3